MKSRTDSRKFPRFLVEFAPDTSAAQTRCASSTKVQTVSNGKTLPGLNLRSTFATNLQVTDTFRSWSTGAHKISPRSRPAMEHCVI